MIVEPRIRGYICTTAHPLGCEQNVHEQLQFIENHGKIEGAKNAIVIGCSGGYGLASRTVAAFGCGANTIGVSLEKEPEPDRVGSAGWYSNHAFDNLARARGLIAESLNGDAFSDAMKDSVIDIIRDRLGEIDLLVYSLAAPLRVRPDTGERFRSVIKPIGETFRARNLVLNVLQGTAKLSEIELEPATEEEIASTVAVMGGEDWQMWVEQLREAGVLGPSFNTVAYTYLGNELTQPIYRGGTLGKAKEHLDLICGVLNDEYADSGLKAYVAVLKAVVTQASTAIPVVPLYFSILFKVMQEAGTHEDCIAHIYRLFQEQLYADGEQRIDEEGRLRMDNLELADETQNEVRRRWHEINDANLAELADVSGFSAEFLRIFGFGHASIDYSQDVDHFERYMR